MAIFAFLAGAVAVPALLLWLGHRLRDRGRAQRGAFWGGVIGHSIAMVVTLVAMHWPPVIWQGGARTTLVFWSMLLGGTLGAAVGALKNR
jgi:hypothetical protein